MAITGNGSTETCHPVYRFSEEIHLSTSSIYY